MAHYYVGSYEKQLTVRPKRQAPLRGELGPERACPTLLFCKRLIASAFHAALECDYRGEPVPAALDALDWLQLDLDYSKLPDKPPQEIREQFYGSMSWACAWLGLDPQATREHGLPREAGNIETGTSFNDFKHVPGIAAVHAAWAKARQHYLANQPEYDAREERRLAKKRAQAWRLAARMREKTAARKAAKRAAQAGAVAVLPRERDPWQAYKNFAGHIGVLAMPEPQWRCLFG